MFFDEKEKIILALLFGSDSLLASEIAQQTGLARTAVYRPLLNLEKEGLVLRSKTEGGDRFAAIDPAVYKKWKEDRLCSLSRELDDIESPRDKRQASLKKTEVLYFVGKESVKNLYHDTWRNNPEGVIYAITDYDDAYETLGDFMRDDYFPERVRRNVHVKNILPRSDRGEIDRKTQKKLLRDMRFVKGLEGLGLEINIYSDRVSLVQFGGVEPVGILVQSSAMSEAFHKIFQCMWEKGRRR